MKTAAENTRLHAPSEAVDTPELDVTPIMNMFVILIPFLVSMAVFTHLSIIEFTLPPNVGTGLDQAAGKPKVKLTVVVTKDYLALTCGDTMLDSLGMADGTFDYDGLVKKIRHRRTSLEIQDETVVAVRDAIRFKRVVRVMDSCREAGFTKIGLSSATEDPSKGV